MEAEAWDSGNDELIASGSKDIKVEADKTTECFLQNSFIVIAVLRHCDVYAVNSVRNLVEIFNRLSTEFASQTSQVKPDNDRW